MLQKSKSKNCIDVWDIDLLDDELRVIVDRNLELIRSYNEEEVAATARREARWDMQVPSNRYRARHMAFVEHTLMPAMMERSIRGWHYTRLTDDEVADLQSEGVKISTIDGIGRRLDEQVKRGLITDTEAAALFNGSPFHSDQRTSREGKFWMSSHPLRVDNHGVRPLLSSWGGESVYFWLENKELQTLVSSIGTPRVVELAVPMSLTRHAFSAAQSVASAAAASLGFPAEHTVFDFYTNESLPAAAVIAVHSAGDGRFERIGHDFSTVFD
jgi:hypothetical protein